MYMHRPVAKAAILAYISGVSDKKFDTLPDLFAPDATWWVSGNPERWAKAGTSPAAEHLPSLPGLINNFDEYEYRLVNLVGEGTKAFAETQAVGSTNDGINYVNNITVTIETDGKGKIMALREYPVHSEITWLLEQFAKRADSQGSE